MHPSVNKSPYSTPYEYGKIKLKTFGDSTPPPMINNTTARLQFLLINLFEIKNARLHIPKDAINDAKYRTLRFIPNIKNNKALNK